MRHNAVVQGAYMCPAGGGALAGLDAYVALQSCFTPPRSLDRSHCPLHVPIDLRSALM